jgi:hypothetical protein
LLGERLHSLPAYWRIALIGVLSLRLNRKYRTADEKLRGEKVEMRLGGRAKRERGRIEEGAGCREGAGLTLPEALEVVFVCLVLFK